MKTLLSILFTLTFGSILFGQATRMPAQTKAVIQVIQKDHNLNRNKPSQHVLDFYPVYPSKSGYQIAVLGKVNSTFDKAQAIRDGLDVGAVIGHIISMRMPLQMLHEGFNYPGIEYIEVAEKLEPELDKAVIETRADLVHKGINLPQAYTGKDVIVGVVDWGFDYTHPMFYDTALLYNRILAAWDQVKIIGNPPPGFSHGAYYSNADELADAQSDTFSIVTDYHGTHVAGIAAGAGAGTLYRGVGFESGLLFSQMRQDASSSIDAFQWMYEYAQGAGRRLVINNSWGSYRSAMDGTSLVSQAIDALSDAGVVFVFSAGNNGDINFHLKKTFDHDSVRTRINGFNYTSDSQLWGQTVLMWGEPGHPFRAKLRILSSNNMILAESEEIYTDTASPYLDTFLIIGPDTVFYNFTTDAAHPLNGHPQMTLNIRSTNQELKKTLFASAESGTVHFWNTRLTKFGGGNWGYGFTATTAGYVNGDRNYGIGHPAVSTTAITTAAHQTNSHLTGFSSYGPRMDELLKPEISAPGQDIISSFSSFSASNFTAVTEVTFHDKVYEFIRLSGTSMSAPMVTGIVSLLLEAYPHLTPHEIKEIITSTAHTDAITGMIGPEGHTRWGYGKVDAYAAVQSLLNTSVVPASSQKNYLYPNPALDKVHISSGFEGNATYRLMRFDGMYISNGHFSGSIDVNDLPPGVYFLNVESNREAETFMFVKKG